MVDVNELSLKEAAEKTPDSAHQASAALHPLSLVFELAHRVRTNLVPAIFASFSAATGGIVGLYIGLGIFGIAIAMAVVRFLTFRYRLTDEHLLVDQGLIFRTHRSVPIERIQNIDSVQNLFHRLFKVAEVRIETAAGNEPEATMRVVSLTEVDRLRGQLTRLSSARSQAQPALAEPRLTDIDSTVRSQVAAEAHPESQASEVVLRITVPQLIKAGLISNRGQVLAGLALGYLWQAYSRGERIEKLASGSDGNSVRSWIRETILEAGQVSQTLDWLGDVGGRILAACAIALFVLLIVLILRVFSAAWFVMKFYDYQLVKRGRDFQIQCGLFTKVSASLPGDRIQVICVHRTWLARWFGLAAIRVEASGGSGKEDEDASTTVARQWFVPIMSMADVPRVLQTLQPELVSNESSLQWQPLAPRAYSRMIRLPLGAYAAVLVAGLGAGWLWDWGYSTIPLLVAIIGSAATILLARKRAKSRKFARTAQGFIYRSGTVVQKTSYGFWNRTQAISLSQSPFDRRWGMASILLDTAGAGTADHPLVVEYLAADVAKAEYAQACQALAEHNS